MYIIYASYFFIRLVLMSIKIMSKSCTFIYDGSIEHIFISYNVSFKLCLKYIVSILF